MSSRNVTKSSTKKLRENILKMRYNMTEERATDRMAGMNSTPSGQRIHIGFFGQRNAGKSSLVNAVTGQ